jgi:hypothetical protein
MMVLIVLSVAVTTFLAVLLVGEMIMDKLDE